jgi:enoyl-CoA hydratase/carnithine racemase
MAEDQILVQREGALGWVIINTPERRNAISLAMWQRLAEVLEAFAADDAVRVVILRGAGERSFAAGADISRFEQERATPEQIVHYDATTGKAHRALAGLPKPSIAMIQGFCVGGGVGLALDCDLRICGETSMFAIPAAKLGVGYGYESLSRLVRIVGPAFAREILYTARRFDAAEAAAMGLVNRVVATGGVEAYVRDYARTIAANAPLTIAAVKRIIDEVVKDPADRDLEVCDRLVRACFVSEDYVEGRRAFMEKRAPVFRGR